MTHPKGLYLLFVTEMAERFSYYGMRALFTLYMVAAFFSKDFASQVYGSYTGLVYLTPLLGGYIADRYWGNNRSIVFGGLTMALGQFLMFLSACFVQPAISAEGMPIDSSVNSGLPLLLMISGLVCLIFGNGFFKPNISTMVGDLYVPQDHRKDSAFTIFYMGINVGAFIAPFVCGTLGEGSWSDLSPFKWGFLCACIAMLVSVAVFVALKKKYLMTPEGDAIGLPPAKSALVQKKKEEEAAAVMSDGIARKNSPLRLVFSILGAVALFFLFSNDAENLTDYISAAIYSISIVMPVFIITDRTLSKVELSRIGVIYIIAVFVIFFWSAFEQAGMTLTYFAQEQTDRMIGDFEVPVTWFQSINPIIVVTFAPVMAMLWEYLGRHGHEPASPIKQAIGLLLLAIGYLVISIGTKGLEPGVKVSMFWLAGLYFIHTLGELSLSPIGLSMVNKLAPAHLASLLMGVWFMSNAASNILAGKLATLYPSAEEGAKSLFGYRIETMDQFFFVFVVLAGVAALLLFALCPLLKRMMKGVE
ncbi:MAG: peptide MFS transporter [Bacteroidales bacterium]|jgi:POT family proton-dependent oligopeptide transporter|nr:peptide MFS transporter [Bacteroidales bacterium]